MLVHQFLEINAERYPNREAIVHLNSRITYSALERDTNRLANYLIKAGVNTGDRIAILVDSSINYVLFNFAVMKVGAVAVALNTATTSRIVSNILNDCTPTAIIAQKRHFHFIKDIVSNLESLKIVVTDEPNDELAIKPDFQVGELQNILSNSDDTRPDLKIESKSLASIIYTSGTTGSPKGVMLSHRNLEANTDSIVEYLCLSCDDKVMAVLPFFYSYGNSLLLTHIRVGGCVVIDNRFAFPNVILDIMAKEKVTGFSGVPSTFAILMHKSNITNYKWEHLRYLTQAGGPMSPALTMKITDALPHVKLYVMYGQTEASARLSNLEPDMLLDKIGSIGIAIPRVTLTVRKENGDICASGEVGEIIATGDNIMTGYWNQPEESAKVLKDDGLHTGDLAKTDEDGFLYIVSRKSDMIKSGAHRISPKEIEEIIAEHDDIIESAVIGVQDEILGENIKAVIVLKPDSTTTAKDIIKHCRINLPPFKVPKIIEIKDSLPKTASGKVKRHLLIDGNLEARR